MNHLKRALRIGLTTAALAVTCVLTTAFAAEQAGVTTDSLRLRAEANASSTVLATAPNGTEISVLENSGDGWYKVI